MGGHRRLRRRQGRGPGRLRRRAVVRAAFDEGVEQDPTQSGYSSFRQPRGSAGCGFGGRASRELKEGGAEGAGRTGESRVGEEGRSRWGPEHLKKKKKKIYSRL